MDQLESRTALDVAFFFTVLDLFDLKFSVDLATLSQLVREDFKVYLVNTKLRQIGGCPEIKAPNDAIFASFFIVLAGTTFSDLDDAIDTELHTLIKSVPKIISGNHLNVSE